jgi:hypothetical protein
MNRIYQAFTMIMLVVFTYAVGYLSGYAVGHNDKLVTEIAKYRVEKKLIDTKPTRVKTK